MDEFTHSERQTFTKNQAPTWDNTAGLSFHIMCVYIDIKKHSAKLYADTLNKIIVKMEDITSPLKRMVLVNYQGDQYVSRNGTRYVEMELYEHINAFGEIQPEAMGKNPRVPDIYG